MQYKKNLSGHTNFLILISVARLHSKEEQMRINT